MNSLCCICEARTFSNTELIFSNHSKASGGGGGGGGGEGGDFLGTDVRARALGILGVSFCPGIRFWEVNFARA